MPVEKNRTQSNNIRPLAIILGLSAVFFVIFLAISGGVYFSSGNWRSGKGGTSLIGTMGAEGAVAVVEVNGVIMDSKKTLRKLEKLEDDARVKAVVIRLNSPGGSVAPSQEIYSAVKSFSKPVVASMGSVAASGAYYVAMGAKKVYANPGTITGSIGVIMDFANLEKLYEWAKIQRFSIKTGKFKAIGAEYKAMTDEERALLQAMVDDVLAQFKTAVAEGRKLNMADVTAVADGRIFSGSQAKEAKLVDELGTLNDAIMEAAKMGGITGKPKVVYPDRLKNRWMEFLMRDSDDDEAESESRVSLLERLLSTWLGAELPVIQKRPPGIYWLWKGAS